MKERDFPLSTVLAAVTFAVMVFALYLVFMWVPTAQEEAGGIAQRIFYFHLPSAFMAFLSFFLVFMGSILYLWKRDWKWDILAHSAAEIGVIFTSLVLISGPIWAKTAWLKGKTGIWWEWDPRLTTTLVMFFIYIAYLLIRNYAAERSQGARFAAVVGIVGFIDVPIVFMAIRWWRTLHPAPVLETGGLHPTMFFTLMVSLAAFLLFFTLLTWVRVRLRQSQVDVEELRVRMGR
jgi:heme exporter protein C